jgi:2-oxoacid:acceptor oxidoreductase gamma subunit (pyruvate/2-ketoisovalerate family)
MLAEAAILSNNYKDCSSFPSFGAERRGAPVEAYCRISDQTIWIRSAILSADIAVILDETHFGQPIIDKLKPECKLIVNTPKTPQDIFRAFNFGHRKGQIATADVTQICLDTHLLLEGQPIVNTPVLGMISRVVDTIPFESITQAIESKFGGSAKGNKNIDAAKKAAELTCILNF